MLLHSTSALRPETPLRPAILGVPFDPLTRKEALRKITEWLDGGVPRQVVTVNSLMILDARNQPDLALMIGRAALLVPDSAGVLWAARLLGRPRLEIYPGVELMLDICRACAARGRAVALFGGRPGVAQAAAGRLAELCPGLRVAGAWHGFPVPEEESRLLAGLKALKPAALFVGTGSPRQELWIGRRLESLGVPVAMGVGGSLDVYAGTVPRAPAAMRRAGLEWLHRVLREPSRLPRILRLGRFVAAVLREKLVT